MFDAAQVGMDLGQLQQRAAPLIQEHSLDALAQTPDVCTYMMNHCILCGKHQSRFSDMVHHLQLDHCTYALASQHHYSKWATARRSPCNVCQHDYKTSHQCKILLQASVLHQWLCHLADAPASHAYPIEDDQDLADHLCVHCAEIFSSDTALERHLREDHSRFCCIRDTVHGTTVCRHCRSHFGEQWELRRHIDRGSCDHLDPMGDQEPGTVLRLDDIFMDQIKAGKWAEALQDSSMRHKLTMTCSFCGQAYARTADLIRHLQCHHGGFFRAADLTSNMIDEARLSCVCNPCRVPQPRSYRCPAHRQMAMLQHLCDPHHRRLMLPWAPTEASVQQLIQLHTLLHAQVPELGQWLLHPDRTSWTFMMRHCQVLSHSCILCSRTFEKSDQLFDHLTQTHRTHSSSCGFLLHAMLRYLLAQRPALADTLPCSWCGNTAKNYSLLDESAWSRLEHQCSSLLNLGCAVAWLRPDLHDG